ncbi:MAG: AAA family ATPase, partial [Clostridia bacterium]|nr:AAA family ATPase [Clostridia bacterium]
MGQRVLVIDTDAGLRSLDILFGLSDNTVYDLSDIFAGRCTPQEAIVASPTCENVVVIAAPPSTDAIPAPADMQYLCRGLAEHYDTVLIDCPAGIGRGFQSAVAAADRAIIVATPDAVCARDAYIASSKLDRIGVSYKMIINRLRPRAVMKGKMPDIDEIMDVAQVPLLGVVPEDEAVTIATANGRPLDKKSYAAECFERIAARFCGTPAPLGRLDKMV